MKLQILGTGCPKCKSLETLARESAEKLGIDFTIEKVSSLDQIVSMGVVSTPALAVDGDVVISGRVPAQGEIEKILSAIAEK